MIGQVWILQPFSVIDFQILSLVFDGYHKILPIQFEWSEIKKYIKVLEKTYEDSKLQDIQNSILYKYQSLILYNIMNCLEMSFQECLNEESLFTQFTFIRLEIEMNFIHVIF